MTIDDIVIPGYRIIEEVGQGSGRVTYKAWDETDECFVAIKVAKPGTDSSNRERIDYAYGTQGLAAKEASAARQLTSERVVRYFGRGELEDERPYVIEEFVDGATLRECIDSGELPSGERLFGNVEGVIGDIFSGVEYIHDKELVHRDLKPSNILIPREWPNEPIKISDLELVAPTPVDPREGIVHHGSRRYSAPEVMEGRNFTKRADLFSLGIIMYEVITGEHLFGSGDTQEVAATILDPRSYDNLEERVREGINGKTRLEEGYAAVIPRLLARDPNLRTYRREKGIIEQVKHLDWSMKLERGGKERKKEEGEEMSGPLFYGCLGIFATAALALLAFSTYMYTAHWNYNRTYYGLEAEPMSSLGIEDFTRMGRQTAVFLDYLFLTEESKREAVHQIEVEYDTKARRDKEQAKEVFEFAQEAEREYYYAESGERDHDLKRELPFLYAVVTQLDPNHVAAWERRCFLGVSEAFPEEELRRVALKAGTNIFTEIYRLEHELVDEEGTFDIGKLDWPTFNDVVGWCETAVGLSTTSPDVFSNLSEMYEFQGNLEAAIKAQERAYALVTTKNDREETQEALYNLARLHEEAGEYEKAHEYTKGFSYGEGKKNKDKFLALEGRIAFELYRRIEANKKDREKWRVKEKLLISAISKMRGAITSEEKKHEKYYASARGGVHPLKDLSNYYMWYAEMRLYQYEDKHNVSSMNAFSRKDQTKLSKRLREVGRTKFKPEDEYYPKPIDDAITALTSAVECNPSNIDAHYMLAEAYAIIGDERSERLAQEQGDIALAVDSQRRAEIEVIFRYYPIKEASQRLAVTLESHPIRGMLYRSRFFNESHYYLLYERGHILLEE